MSVEDLARRTGLAPTTIYDLERGDSFSTTRLHRIAAALSCSIRWLETGRGSPTPSTEETLLSVTEDARGWPFSFPAARFDRLTTAQRDQIERVVLALISDFDASPRPKRPVKVGVRQS